MIKIGNNNLNNRYITDSEGAPQEVKKTYVGDNLIYLHVQDNDAQFYKRATANSVINDGVKVNGSIKSIKGNTIVWNQCFKNGKTNTGVQWNTDGTSIPKDYTEYTAQEYDTQTGGAIYLITPGHIVYYKLFAKADSITEGYLTQNLRYINLTVRIDSTKLYDCKRAIETVGDGDDYYTYRSFNNITATNVVYGLNVIDLTKMFGAGNEPTTVDEFEALFPLDYYEYDEGSIIPFAGQNLVTTGFNQFNGEYEEGDIDTTTGENHLNTNTKRCIGFIPVLSDINYYCQKVSGTGISIWMAFYDSNKNIISEGLPNVTSANNVRDVKNKIFIMPSNCAFVRFYLKKDSEALFNISNPDRNGTYKPYEEHTLPIPVTTLTGKVNGQGESIVIFPNGMHGIGNAKDEIDFEHNKAIKRIGSVDLGTLDWGYDSSGHKFYKLVNGFVPAQNTTTVANCICDKYVTTNQSTLDRGDDKVITIYTGPIIYIRDTAYSDPADFKEAMSGVILYYELAEPVEIDLDNTINGNYIADTDGTEEITPANGTVPYTSMPNLSILYTL